MQKENTNLKKNIFEYDGILASNESSSDYRDHQINEYRQKLDQERRKNKDSDDQLGEIKEL